MVMEIEKERGSQRTGWEFPCLTRKESTNKERPKLEQKREPGGSREMGNLRDHLV